MNQQQHHGQPAIVPNERELDSQLLWAAAAMGAKAILIIVVVSDNQRWSGASRTGLVKGRETKSALRAAGAAPIGIMASPTPA